MLQFKNYTGNAKMILVKTVPAIRGGRMWERSQGGGGGIQV
jgi:hypothetical protein